ncbi:phosphoglycolate phosphatase [Rhodovulum sp. 12E13]|uniref:phosphoglycolate phosphatase n=1 Tax=Rhodovulum sp. 12E13 TaxID=2203891 RepID=UPI000E15126C|nr:phosphoglycolate phosphatase [Rhodovulum sp. 12E13]RDC72387.1 phosphoglycolate phosphatase [Rhodovulum sp. 12E13]
MSAHPSPEAPAIVFDLDGTLVDSAPDICAVANAVLAGEGAAPLTLAEARGYVGSGADMFVRRMRAARGLPDAEHDRLLAAFLDRYEGAVEHSALYPGVLDALALLTARGHALGVCTNKPIGPTRTVLAHFGLAHRFAAVLGGDSLAVRKPDPAPLLAVFAELGAPGGLYVGDSEVDAETADRAGVPFLLFTEGYRKAPVETLTHAAAFAHFDRLAPLVEARASRSA